MAEFDARVYAEFTTLSDTINLGFEVSQRLAHRTGINSYYPMRGTRLIDVPLPFEFNEVVRDTSCYIFNFKS